LIHFERFKLNAPIVTPKAETLPDKPHFCLCPPKPPAPGKVYKSDVEKLLEKMINDEISASFIGERKEIDTDRDLLHTGDTERDKKRQS